MDDARYPIIAEKGEWNLADKCAHKDGAWRFEFNGILYGFIPPTQLQKDIWIAEAKSNGPQGKEARVQALRWACLVCKTVQMP